ncbi:MAG: pyridoxal phosphate-dependent aminotransferase [Syntrophales bacterium]
MAISKKIQGFLGSSSWIRKMFEEGVSLKNQYGAANVFDFSLGNPNLEPPLRFKELLRLVAGKDIPGMHGYMPNAGYPETRSAVASCLRKEHGVLSLSAEHIIMTCGAGGALNVILKTLLDPGDEVIIPAPFFVEYRFYVDNSGGITKLVKTKEDFSLDLGEIDITFTEKTKVVLINSPNNPTGKVYGEATIRELTALIEEKSRLYRKDIYLISDEPYRDIVYDGVKVPSIMSACKNSVIASSYSKSLSLAGERIGFIAVNPEMADAVEVVNGMILCNRMLGFVNAPALMQRIVSGMQGERVDVEEYRRKRDMLCDGLSSFGYRFTRPEGAFYLFVRAPIEDDIEFVRALQRRKILTVPGSGFEGAGYFRIAYCVDDATIINAMEGFRQTLKEYLKF